MFITRLLFPVKLITYKKMANNFSHYFNLYMTKQIFGSNGLAKVNDEYEHLSLQELKETEKISSCCVYKPASLTSRSGHKQGRKTLDRPL